MITERHRILAVIDPTRRDQWALRRAIAVAKNREDADVIAFLGTHSDLECDDPEELRTIELARQKLWLDSILGDFVDSSVVIEPVVVWNEDWREAICLAAENPDVDLVIKRASRRGKSLGSSDRQLIRNLGEALLLVKRDPAMEMKKILVAIDFNAKDEDHVALNDAVVTIGNRIRGAVNQPELHSITAYPKAEKFVHPPDIAKKLGIDRSQAHVGEGAAAEVIPEVANEIGADLVIVGNVGRRGLSGVTVGNTAEKILTDVGSDVLVLVKEPSSQRSAA